MNTNKETSEFILPIPVITLPEFRLYYDKETGKALFYTCEKPEGDYIVIDAAMFAQSRPDAIVINGKISTVHKNLITTKLKPHPSEGQPCHSEDVSVIVDENSSNMTRWKLSIYEIK